MDSKLKYRLVGAGVIVAIMAFFLPLILDSKKYRTEIVSQIPPMPQQDTGQMSRFEAEQLELETKVKAAKKHNIDANEGQLFIDLEADPDKAVTKVEPQTRVSQPEPVVQNNEILGKQKVEEAKQETIKKALDEKARNQDKVVASKTVTTQASKPEKTSTKNPSKQNKAQQVAAKAQSNKAQQPKEIKKDVKRVVKNVKKPVKQVASQPSKVKQKEPTPKPSLKENYYLIQIGTFSNKANASKLVTNLRDKEYRAYERVSKKFSRVFVGPYPDKKSAEKRAKKLETVVGSKVKIVVFDPVVH